MKYKFKRTPRAYQLAALQKALKLNKSIAIWFDPGLGKTKVAIDFMAIKQMKGELSRILIICPLSAIGVWEDEIPLDHPQWEEMAITPVVGDTKDRLETLNEVLSYKGQFPQTVIINYDVIYNEQVFKLLKEWSPQFLIVDEMHYCKNAQAQRSKLVYKVRQWVTWVMGLTGTPIPKNPLDIFGQYKILDDTIFGTRFNDFKNQYAEFHPVFRNKPIAWKNLDDMAQKIHTIACRVKDTEAKQLPPLIEQDIPVYFSSKTKKVYKQMAKEMIAELDGMETVTAAMAAVKAGKLQQITGGFLQRTDVSMVDGKVKKQTLTFPVGTEKLDVFIDLVDKYIDNHKILVGCRFLWEITQIEARLTKRKIGFVTIKGGVDGAQRAEYRRKFQSDPKCRVIIFQVSAATAMTLTAGDIGILYSCTRKFDDYWQWLKRIHRDGQDKPVYILRLLVKGTIDREVINDINQKRQYTTDIVDKSAYRDMLKPKF